MAMDSTNAADQQPASKTGATVDDADFARRVQIIEDKLAISELAARFADACNTRDDEEFRKLWLPDGVWEISEPLPARAEGIEQIIKMLDDLLGAWEFFFQMTHSGTIKIDGDRATARWMMQETARKPEEAGFYNNFAFYEDELARVDGRWLFSCRRYEYIYLDESKLPGKSFPPDTKLDI